jgi:hypothetical protein
VQEVVDMHESLVHDGWAKDVCGYIASGLVLCTFSVTSMQVLRCIGIASNIAFISCAIMTRSTPILILHSLLLPMNIYRLVQIWQPRRGNLREVAS